MALLTLLRVGVDETGAYGVLRQGQVPFAVTLERTYTVDGLQIVKIPPGHYECRRTRYEKGKYDTYEIMVPGHSRMLFHKLNVETESEGCVGVAEEFGLLHGDPAILRASHGFEEFMQRTGGRDRWVLEVTDRLL